MKYILKYKGGSHSYSLNTPSSDSDERGLFLHTLPKHILGLNRWDHQENKAGGADEMYFEVRHFIDLLRKGNTQCYEMLFLKPNQIELDSPEWKSIKAKSHYLLDSDRLYKSVCGYIQSERRLAVGERTGKLGGKRYDQVIKLGFSPKNLIQLYRLCWAATWFFNYSIFPVDISEYDSNLALRLLKIKTDPQEFNKDELIEGSYINEELMKESFKNRQTNFIFDEDFANNLLLSLYIPHLLVIK